MASLLEYIERDRIAVLDDGAHDELLRRLVDLCLRDDAPEPRDRMRADLLRAGRMKDQPLGQGFAITHARLDDLPDIRAGLGLLGPGARFSRGAPPHTVFCAIVPAGRSSHYLSFMARLSRMLLQPGAADVFRARDPDRIMDLVRRFES